MQHAGALKAGTACKTRINHLANMFCVLCPFYSINSRGHQFSSYITLDPRLLPSTKDLNFSSLLFSRHEDTGEEKVSKSQCLSGSVNDLVLEI